MPDTDQRQTQHKPHEPLMESTDEIQLRPDGEERFRAAVRAAAKSGPMHRAAKAKA